MKTIMENNIVKKIDLDARVDYDTARCLMLMGMPQGVVEELRSLNGKKVKGTVIRKQGNPFYVTSYRINKIHEFVKELNNGYIHMADKMCYAPTVRESLEFVKKQLLDGISVFSLTNEISFEIARVLCYLGMPQGWVLSEWKKTKAQLHRYGEHFYVTIYKTNTVRKLVSLNKGHDRDADAMCYAPTMDEALRWVEAMLCND